MSNPGTAGAGGWALVLTLRPHAAGEQRKRFNADVRALVERAYGREAFDLPLETKLYVLEKRAAGGQQQSARGTTLFSS